jgi:hypothetical protein
MTVLPPPVTNATQVAEAKRYGAARGINPFVAILEEVRRTAGHVAWLGTKVAESPTDNDLLEGHLMWLKLYMNERDRLIKVSETAVRLGLEERVIKLEERKAEIMVRAFLASLEELGIPAEVLEAAPGVLRKNLLALEVADSQG